MGKEKKRKEGLKTESFSRNGSNSSFTKYQNHLHITRQGKTRRSRRKIIRRAPNNNDNGTKKK